MIHKHLSFSAKITTLSLFLFIVGFLSAGNLLSSRQSSYKTYVYRLSEAEALNINKKGTTVIDSTYFHQLVSSYPTDSASTEELPAGHYLKTFLRNDKQEVSYTYVPEFNVMLLNNNTDLCIQIYSLKGELITNAKVWINYKKLRLDKQTLCFTERKSNRSGILKVEYKGNTTYLRLTRQLNNSTLHRISGKVIYGTPLRYIWSPVNYIIRLPIDGVRSISRRHPTGVIYKTRNFFHQLWTKITNDDDYDYRSRDHYLSYMVFSKPKYMPGDTVKFKAFILKKKNGKPIDKTVFVTLYNQKKSIQLAKLAPYRDGAYEYSFALHDSLDLQLDKSCTVSLENKDGNDYISNSFDYEQYELKDLKLTLRRDAKKMYRHVPFKIWAKGTNENELNVQDARLEVVLSSNQVSETFGTQTIIPDTLWSGKLALKPSGETEILIPDSVFPAANLSASLHVKMLTTDNQLVSESKSFEFYHKEQNVSMNVVKDSLRFTYTENGIKKVVPCNITALDNFGNKTVVDLHQLPGDIYLNPYFSNYQIKLKDYEQYLNVSSLSSPISCSALRNRDSVFFEINNPSHLHFSYNIYKVNKEIQRGNGQELKFSTTDTRNKNFYLSLRYLWGGAIKTQTFTVGAINRNNLNISISQPNLIYPGQKTDVEIKVTDYKNRPVENVDLTAYSLTSKFKEDPVRMPFFNDQSKTKSVINNFNITQNHLTSKELPVSYNFWKTLAEIDSIEYYRFLFPVNGIYRYEYTTSENITQFAPFVKDKYGEEKKIHVIYVDNKPVYFAWNSLRQPYAVRITPGNHQIRIRLSDREITLENQPFSAYKKTILSIAEDYRSKECSTILLLPGKLLENEIMTLNEYIFPVRNSFGKEIGYIENNNSYQILNFEQYMNSGFVGPVSGVVKAGIVNGYNHTFSHEPGFQYELQPNIIKMRESNKKWWPTTDFLQKYGNHRSLTDTVMSWAFLERLYQQKLDDQRKISHVYYNPSKTEIGSGKIELHNKPSLFPLNYLIFKTDDEQFIRIYSGQTSTIHNLLPGSYKIIRFFPGNRYDIIDSVQVRPNSYCYLNEPSTEQLRKDSFSIKLSKLIESMIYEQPNVYAMKQNLQKAEKIYHEENPYTGEGVWIEGSVLDNGTKEPIIGATIKIIGTNYGTSTNMDGKFRLKVPYNHQKLSILSIGFEPQELDLKKSSSTQIFLKESVLKLDEVVVVGYGVLKRNTLTGSITTINTNGLMNLSNTLQGRIAGISVGATTSIRVRGAASIDFEQKPLVIINGMVYTGDISQLDPSQIENIEVLKDAAATSLYGSRGANGVLIISSKEESLKKLSNTSDKGAEFDQEFLEAAGKSGSLRKNFSDLAYWQPRLATNKEGIARFTVTFPDDITSWSTHVLAMTDNRKTGQFVKLTKSFKPVMARLSVPNFLNTSDTVQLIGKSLNYLPDSIRLQTQLKVNQQSVIQRNHNFKDAAIDSVQIVANTDTLSVQYSLQRNDGYFDGEQRKIPVLPVGLEEVSGKFMVLDSDTTLNINGQYQLSADAGSFSIFNSDIAHLLHYRFNCNEQISSKLNALLSERQMAQFSGKKITQDKEIEKMIRLLEKNRNQDLLWGWWKDTPTHYEFSAYIIKTLAAAKKAGFQVPLSEKSITDQLISQLEHNNKQNADTRIHLLSALKSINAIADYSAYIGQTDTMKNLSLTHKLRLIELRQACRLSYSTDLLRKYQQQTMLGNIFFRDDKSTSSLLSNDISNTLVAYRILRNQASTSPEMLKSIRRYFVERKQNYCFWNTYETANIITTLLPDLLKQGESFTPASLQLQGAITRTVKEFPFQAKTNSDKQLTITKTGSETVYLTLYNSRWNSNPTAHAGDFEIQTNFENTTGNRLVAGKMVKLQVHVKVKKDAEYIMVQVPIPAGCTYSSKRQGYPNEIHREYFNHETNIFCDKLKKGDYTFEVELQTRFSGHYTLNPAKVELMYFPSFNANNELKKVEIK